MTDLKGTWRQAIFSFFGSILFILFLRWVFFEPYLVPSASMEKTLLINDFILVNKFAYGLRLPFSDHWLYGPSAPKPQEVVVFRSKDQSNLFLVKRVIAVEGQRVLVADNDIEVTQGIDGSLIPKGEMFVAGDNRSHSQDSRYFGTVPLNNLLGRASMIWLSCEKLLQQQRLCDPQTLRWNRIFLGIY